MSGTWEGGCSLSANLLQADVCFGAQRVERSPVACAPAAADGWIVGPGADVTRGAAAEGQDLLERGVPVSAGGAARSVLVSGDLHRWPQPHGLCAGAVEAAAKRHVELTQRNEELLAEISRVNLELLRRRLLR